MNIIVIISLIFFLPCSISVPLNAMVSMKTASNSATEYEHGCYHCNYGHLACYCEYNNDLAAIPKHAAEAVKDSSYLSAKSNLSAIAIDNAKAATGYEEGCYYCNYGHLACYCEYYNGLAAIPKHAAEAVKDSAYLSKVIKKGLSAKSKLSAIAIDNSKAIKKVIAMESMEKKAIIATEMKVASNSTALCTSHSHCPDEYCYGTGNGNCYEAGACCTDLDAIDGYGDSSNCPARSHCDCPSHSDCADDGYCYGTGSTGTCYAAGACCTDLDAIDGHDIAHCPAKSHCDCSSHSGCAADAYCYGTGSTGTCYEAGACCTDIDAIDGHDIAHCPAKSHCACSSHSGCADNAYCYGTGSTGTCYAAGACCRDLDAIDGECPRKSHCYNAHASAIAMKTASPKHATEAVKDSAYLSKAIKKGLSSKSKLSAIAIPESNETPVTVTLKDHIKGFSDPAAAGEALKKALEGTVERTVERTVEIAMSNDTLIQARNTQKTSGCIEAGIDYNGWDIEWYTGVGWYSQCQTICYYHSQCWYFTYNIESQNCYMKWGIRGRWHHNDAISGPWRC